MSNRTINVAAGATYIEKQENNFYGNSQQVWNDAKIGETNSEQKADETLRDLNETDLEGCFKATFKGAGRNIDYFHPNLLPDLRKTWSAKQHAMIALMIYESQWLSAKPATFQAWYKDYCRMVGCEYIESYHPSKLAASQGLRKVFYYL